MVLRHRLRPQHFETLFSESPRNRNRSVTHSNLTVELKNSGVNRKRDLR